jgi:sugar lactone lactonase YvrE/phosphodiesterase/alkaline phosphatase D-like protein
VPSLPVAISEAASVASPTEATLHGSVNPQGIATEYLFEYGETTAYGTSVPVKAESIGSGSKYVELGQLVKGLKGQRTYHFRITAINAKGTYHGADQTFGTTPPAATTTAATGVHANDATLAATVNSEGSATSYYFEFGPTSAYGRLAPARPFGAAKPKDIGAGTSPVNVTAVVGGLTGSKTYHYRVVAKNIAGTAYGKDETFTTPSAEWSAESTPDITPGAGKENYLTDISCTSQKSCIVLAETYPFEYVTSEAWDGAKWSTYSIPSVEGAKQTYPLRISCSSSSWCVAVGSYSTASSWAQPLVEQWDGEKWTVGSLPPLPLDGINGQLLGISCSSASACTAVGRYWIPAVGSSSGESLHLLVERWDGSEWKAETADPPHTRFGALTSVSCTSSSDCVAAGYYSPENNWHALAEHWDGQEWSVIQDSTPAGVEYPSLTAVSCAAAGACTALGYLQSGEHVSPERWNGEAWTTESLPAPAGLEKGANLSGLSCPSIDFCAAAGFAWIPGYGTSYVPATYAWDGSKWTAKSTTELTQQKEGSFLSGSYLKGVSCLSASRCMAAGNYIDQEPKEFNGVVETYGPAGPAATTKAANQIRMTAARLNASVNPGGLKTTYQFQYGKTKSYGSLAPAAAAEAGSGNADVEAAQSITGLKPATTYHYRAIATSSKGTSYGEDKRFTTRGPMPSFALSVGKLGSGEGQLDEPLGIALDASGNLWVADTENNRIEKFNSKGEYLSQFGSKGSGNGQFSQPYALAVDGSGNLWVADTFNSRIEKFNAKGEYLSQIGSQGSGNGQLYRPYGLGFDSAGNLWVADTWNQRIEKFNSKGEYLSQFKTSASPTDIAADSEGNLWVSEYALHRVRKFNSKGEQLIQIGGTKGSGAGQFNEPWGLGVDPDGSLWVADSANGRLQEFNPAGEYLGQFGKAGTGSGEFNFPRDVAFDGEGSAWVADSYNSRLQKWPFGPSAATEAATSVGSRSATFHATVNPQGHDTTYRFEYGETTAYGAQAPATAKSIGAGTEDVEVAATIKDLKPETTYHARVLAVDSQGLSTYGEDRSFTTKSPMPVFSFKAGSQGSGGGQFAGPEAVAADAKGNVWVLDTYGNRVEEFDPTGKYLFQFGSQGSEPGQLFHPEGIAIDASGNIWIADSFNSRVEEFGPEGKFLLQVGSYGSGNGKFEIPSAITINRTSGDIYVGDKTNRVQRFNSKGEYLSQFGSKGTGNGQFEAISGIAADSASGNAYVADATGNRVQKFNAKGEYLSQFGSKGSASGQFVSPHGMAVEGNGNLLVVDTGNNRFQKFSPEGKFLGRAGAWGEDDGQFATPTGIAVDGENGVWVVEPGNYRIQKWTYELPTATTEAAAAVKATQATLNGTVNPKGASTNYYFEYGPTTSYGIKIPTGVKAVGSGTSNVAVSQMPTGLAQNTTYHYRVVAESEAGTTYGADKTLTTLKAPKATTEAATGVKSTSATLNATVNPEGTATTYQFEYGETTAYGFKAPASPKSAGSGTSNVAVSEAITGLEGGTTYHYRVVAAGEVGTTNGEDKTFTTSSAAWAIQSTPNPSTDATFKDVSCASASECIAVGSSVGSTSPISQRWNGTEWSTLTTPTEGIGALGDVSCASTNSCLAISVPGYFNAERWNGSEWTISTPKTPEGAKSASLYGVSCASSTFCVAVGLYDPDGVNKRTLAESWNGSSWTILTTPSEEKGFNALYAVSCTSSTSCTALGVKGEKPLALRWNGSEWSTLAAPKESSTVSADLSCASASACTAVLGGSVKVERWNGSEWSAATLPTPEGGGTVTLNGVSCPSASACTATGFYVKESKTLTLAERWNGSEWSVQTTPNPEAGGKLNGVSCSSPSRCTTVGSYSPKKGENKTLAERYE